MEPKREVTSVGLVALVGELGAYTGATVDKAYLYADGLVRLKMRDYDRGRIELLIQVGERKRVHVTEPEFVPAAPDRPPNFAKMLRNRIAGADLASVSQHGFDRILEFEFRRGDADTTIVAELFGEGNLAVLDESGAVIDSLSTVRLRSRTVAPGAQYGFPESRINPLEMDYEAFAATMAESDTDLVRTMATQLNFGGTYGEELCTRAGVEKTLDITEAGETEYRRLYAEMTDLLDRLREGDTDPRVYREDGAVVDVTPVPMEEYADLESEAYDTFNAALDAYFRALEDREDEPETGESSGPDFDAEIEKRERIIEQQEQAIEDFERRAETEREKAQALYANYDFVDEIIRTVREARESGHSWPEIESRLAEGAEAGIEAAAAVTGIDESEGMIRIDLDDHEIPLDPRSGVEKNADRLYTGAKEIESKRDGALEAIEDTRAELAALKERKAGYEEEAAEAEDEKPAEDVDWLARESIPIRRPEKWYDRFRSFRTSDGFLVLGGRNAEQNEELVAKYMEHADRFFHTQAHGGPATILKTSEPSEPTKDIEVPEQSLREAAQFAVTYSTIWKQGQYSGDVYMVSGDQVSKTPESGEYLEKGGFAIRGDRTYFEDTPVGAAVGIACEPETRVLGGPPEPIEAQTETSIRIEPGRYAQGDVAKRVYREFRERFTDTTFVRKIASPDEIQKFMPPGTSRISEGEE
ncbi:ribosome rescue protein RqcH [Halodesulfurarchaeum formicicum]|uniref:Archaeal Rqc2 homolog aRqcH n=1 Tax=Halodesulfurarchaeum formicicum TaxID=1873524 RepID=A0A1J1AAJ4_9EURY|nr:ribosome rescue protein RqcH [Halodesulfurarchaeum formicicum]APE95166.1 fibronectin-binding protein [Halodesulfurarchaeum formicicum]